MPTAPEPRSAKDIAIRWGTTLVEPLLPLHRRVALEREFAGLARSDRRYLTILLAGVASDMMRSLPESDPWRKLHARIGSVIVGDPPERTGAWHPDGSPFGTWTDSLDLSGTVFPDPAMDPALAAVADPITASTAAVVAVAATDWQRAVEALVAVEQVDEPAGTPRALQVVGEPARTRTTLLEAGTTAVRWGAHRRRLHGATDDVWPVESLMLWSWRAEQVVANEPWPVHTVERDIAANRLPEPDELTDF